MRARQIQFQAADAAGKLVPIIIVLVIAVAVLVNACVIVESATWGWCAPWAPSSPAA